MAIESNPLYVDSKNVTASSGSASEALTTRDIRCQSVFILPKSTNSGTVFLVDNGDEAKIFPISAAGLTLPISDPSKVKVSTDNSGDDVDWVAM